jgi:hypothetical protein
MLAVIVIVLSRPQGLGYERVPGSPEAGDRRKRLWSLPKNWTAW